MKEQTRIRCEQFIENRRRIQSVYSWDSGIIHIACAGIFTAKNKLADESLLIECKHMIKEKTGFFSNFRGSAESPVAAMLAASSSPSRMLENGLQVYQLLRQEFWSSSYLPLTAMILAQLADPQHYEELAARTKTIYLRMKQEHPFLTSEEDSAFCALLALSEKHDDELIRDAEICYQILKPDFFSSNAVQSLSHVLALCEGPAEQKCARVMELFQRMKRAGRKYGTEYELPALGVLAMDQVSAEEIVAEVFEIDDWLSSQKGFGFFSSITRQQRLMYAGILAQNREQNETVQQTAAINGTISMMIAQEAAMCAAIMASSAAAASAASSD